MPLASVIIPSYNCAESVCSAIDSVLSQEWQDFEILVVDDGSKDATRSVINQYVEKFKGRIRCFFQENKGPSAARNLGIREAVGEYIAFLDADDLWDACMLKKTMSVLHGSAFDWIFTGDYRIVKSASGQVVSSETHLIEDVDFTCRNYPTLLAARNFIGGPSKVIVRRDAFEKAGLFDERLFDKEDWDLWIRFSKAGLKITYLNEALYYYLKKEEDCVHKTRKNYLKSNKIFLRKLIQYGLSLDRSLAGYYSDFLWDFARQSFFIYKNYSFTIYFILESFRLKFRV